MSEARPFRRRVLLNTASTGVGNAWAMVVALISVPLLLRGLGAAAFGVWVLLQTFSAITGWLSLADAGIGTSATKTIAERASLGDQAGAARAVSTSLALFLGLAVGCAALLAIVGRAILPDVFNAPPDLVADLRTAVLLFAGQTVADLLTEGCEACLEGLQRVDLSRLVDGIRRTGVAAATSAVALAGGGLVGVAAASLVASVVAGTLVAAAVLRRRVGGGWLRPSRADARSLVSYAKAIAVLRPLGVIHRTMDRLIVGAAIGPEAVTLVEIATQIHNGADAVLSASSYAVVPTAPWLRARGDEGALRELLLTGTKYALLATAPVAVVAALLAHPLVRVWVGDPYAGAAGLAVVALAAVALAAPVQVASSILVGVGRAGVVLRAAGAALAVNLVSSLILVQVVGVVGVFQGSVLGTLVLIPALGRAGLRELGVGTGQFVREAVRPVVVPAAALAVVTGGVRLAGWGDWPSIVLGGAAGLAAFAVAAWRLSFDAGELRGLGVVLARGGGGRRDGRRPSPQEAPEESEAPGQVHGGQSDDKPGS